MKNITKFHQIAEEREIAIYEFPLQKQEALSLMDQDGRCYIALSPNTLRGEADKTTKLAHELGHCITGSFYNPYTPYDLRQKHENCADKWAVRQTVPEEEMVNAVAEGYSPFWELADYFCVTIAFMKKAICFYTYGNVAAELYF